MIPINFIRRLVKGSPLTAIDHDNNLNETENAIRALEDQIDNLDTGVTEVNGQTGSVTITRESLGAAAEEHTHPIGAVEGLGDALAGKSDSGHSHPIGGVTGLQDALDALSGAVAGKADSGHRHDEDYAEINHGHTIEDISGLRINLDEIESIISDLITRVEALEAVPEPQQITSVVLIGDSITERSFGRSLSTPNAYMSSQLGVPVYGYGWSGDRIWQTETRLDTALGQFTDPGTLFVIMTGMNDVRDHRPLSGQDALDVEAEYQSLISKLDGRLFQFASVNYAHFGDNRNMLLNPDNGVKPFNDILKTLIPASNKNIDNEPYLDVYNWVRNDPTLLHSDGFHLSSTGESALRDFYVSRLKWLIDGTAKPAVIVPKDPEEIEPGISDPKIVISLRHTSTTAPGVNQFLRNTHQHSGQTYDLFDSNGSPTGATIRWIQTTSDTSASGIGATNSGQSLPGTYQTNGLLSGSFNHAWFASEGHQTTHVIEGLKPNTEYIIEAMSAVSGSQYPGVSGLAWQDQEITWNALGTPAVHQMTVQSDGTGKIELIQAGTSGWNFVGGIRISGDFGISTDITFIDGTWQYTNNLSVPEGVMPGDYVMAFLINNNSDDIPAEPSGWTTIAQENGNSQAVRVVGMRYTGPGFDTHSPDSTAVSIRVYRNVHTDPVVHVASMAGGGSTSSLPAQGNPGFVVEHYVHRSNITPELPEWFSTEPPVNARTRFSGYGRGWTLDHPESTGLDEYFLGTHVNSGYKAFRIVLRKA